MRKLTRLAVLAAWLASMPPVAELLHSHAALGLPRPRSSSLVAADAGNATRTHQFAPHECPVCHHVASSSAALVASSVTIAGDTAYGTLLRPVDGQSSRTNAPLPLSGGTRAPPSC